MGYARVAKETILVAKEKVPVQNCEQAGVVDHTFLAVHTHKRCNDLSCDLRKQRHLRMALLTTLNHYAKNTSESFANAAQVLVNAVMNNKNIQANAS